MHEGRLPALLRVYVSEQVTTRDQAARYLASALPVAAGLVHSRLRHRVPDRPADELAAELTSLAVVL